MKTIADRIKQYVDENYDSNTAEASRALGAKGPYLRPYIMKDGKQPGTPALLRMHKAGWPIEWIVTGKYPKLEKEKALMLDLLKEYDIHTATELKKRLEFIEIVRRNFPPDE